MNKYRTYSFQSDLPFIPRDVMAAFRIPFRSLPPLGKERKRPRVELRETLTESIEQNAAGRIRRRRISAVIAFNFAAAPLLR